MTNRTADNTKLPLLLEWFVRVHRWWQHRRMMRKADTEAQQLHVLIGEANVAFMRDVCLDIAAETDVYVSPCEIVQAILSAVADSDLDLSRCGGGYADIKQRIKRELTSVRPDIPVAVAVN